MYKLTTVFSSVAGDSLGYILVGKNNFPIVLVAIGTDGQGETFPHHISVISPEVHHDDIHVNYAAIAKKVNEIFDIVEMEQEKRTAEIGKALLEHIAIDF